MAWVFSGGEGAEAVGRSGLATRAAHVAGSAPPMPVAVGRFYLCALSGFYSLRSFRTE